MTKRKSNEMSIQDQILASMLKGEVITAEKASDDFKCPSLQNIMNRLHMKGIPFSEKHVGSESQYWIANELRAKVAKEYPHCA